jgi:ABC-type Mn2+/Zn2+ transport system permease subunit
VPINATSSAVTGTVRGLVACALAVALAEGVVGLYLAYWLDVPAGPPVAALGALVCVVLAAATGRSV